VHLGQSYFLQSVANQPRLNTCPSQFTPLTTSCISHSLAPPGSRWPSYRRRAGVIKELRRLLKDARALPVRHVELLGTVRQERLTSSHIQSPLRATCNPFLGRKARALHWRGRRGRGPTLLEALLQLPRYGVERLSHLTGNRTAAVRDRSLELSEQLGPSCMLDDTLLRLLLLLLLLLLRRLLLRRRRRRQRRRRRE